MTPIIIMLSIIFILILGICILLYTLKKKFETILLKYFGTKNIKAAIDTSKVIEESTPKSISSMENILLPMIERDFNDLNINELKRMAEDNIIYFYNCLENKEAKENKKISDKVITNIKSKISDLNNSTVHFDSIKFHKTALKDYENKGDIVSIRFASSLEYDYKKDGKETKKIQTRMVTEFIYAIDTSYVHENEKNIGLNCPNCGAPITSTKSKSCKFCGTGLVDIVKRVWILNDIKEY